MKLYTSLLREYQQGSPDRGNESPVTWKELSDLRNHLDELWSKLGVDISFSHHFFERVNDPRNRKQITIGELEKLFSQTYARHGQNISVKVKPGSDNEFEAVLTDLSTKVNLPFVLKWDRDRRELRLVAKTVMRKDNFVPAYNNHGQHKVVPKLTVQHFEPQGKVITETKMKTFSDIKEWVGWNTPEVAPVTTTQAVDDIDSSAHAVEKPEILDKLNAYCHDIANHQYMNPYYPLHTLWRKLMLIGINFDLKKIMLNGDTGRVEVPLTQYGGRFGVGVDPGTYIGKDDGTRVHGGLNLVITFHKTGGVYNLDAQIEKGAPGVIGFGEEAIAENEEKIGKADIFHHLTKHGFEYSPDEMGNDSYHHPSGHSFYVGKHGDNFWHEHNGQEKASGGAFPGHTNYTSALHAAKRLTDKLKKK